MKLKILFVLIAIPVLAGISFAQKKTPADTSKPATSPDGYVTASPAYAEVLLLKTGLEAELESLVVEYTEEYPGVKKGRYELTLIKRDIERLRAVKSTESSRLTLALGKLMVRKIELEVDLWELRAKYNDEHPDVKRAKRKVEIFEAAIKEILG